LLLGLFCFLWLAALPALLLGDGDFARGAIVGSTAVLSVTIPTALVGVFAGLGPTTAGESAEQWTADAVESVKDHGWQVAHSVRFEDGYDADHVLVGPGGVIVIETKWSSYDWTLDDRRLRSAMGQVSRRAGLLSRRLAREVTPVVVLWGRAAAALDGTSGRLEKAGVRVMSGDALPPWVLGRPRNVLSQQAQESAWLAVVELARAGDAVEGPIPRGVVKTLVTTVRAVVIGTLAFGLPAALADVHLAAWVTASVALAIAGLAARRQGWRAEGTAVMAGSLGGMAIIGVLTAVLVLTG
jgi:hypothetical protein